MTTPLLGPFLAYAAKLRFPTLFKITLAVFLLDLLIPDLLPFADEILLGLGALLLANFQKPAGESPTSIEARPPIDVDPTPKP